MSNFDDELNGQQFGDYADDDRQGDGLIRIQWRQGDVKHGTPGYFFLSKKNVPDGFQPSGEIWKPHTEYFEMTRTRDDGWKAESLPVLVICARAQPFQRGDVKTWLDTWPKGAAQGTIGQHADVLMVADGLQELGVVCWSTNSTTVAFAIISNADPKRNPEGGILYRIREEVLGGADTVSKTFKQRRQKKLYWLFWITITSQRDAKGNVVFTPTNGKDVTLPVPVLPDRIDAKWLTAAYAGKENVAYGEAMRAAYDVWRLTKFTNDAQPTAQPAGRNVPQPVDDLPF